MNYTRRRALLACDFCRHRKRRCDGERPCSTCRESGADCRYKDLPVERVELPSTSATGSDLVAERLGRIEGLLEEHSHRLNELAQAHQGGGMPAPFQPNLFSLPPSYSYPLPEQLSRQQHQEFQGVLHRHELGRAPLADPHLENAQFLIPTDHFTSASSLFALPRVRNMVGEYPKNYFHDIEDALPLPQPLDIIQTSDIQWPSLERLGPQGLDALATAYFACAHPNYPLFTEQDFAGWRSHVFEHGLADTPETAICLTVWALGAVVPGDQPVPLPMDIQAEKDQLGLTFFQPALRIILRFSLWGFKPNMTICQALLLAASYFAHLGRPLHSWKMVYFASLKFMFLFDKQRRSECYLVAQDKNHLRVFWSCFMIECDRAAELDVPRSGIEPMADRMQLAQSLTPGEHEEMIYFVAETAIRRLLNRVHSSLYSSENSDLVSFADIGPRPGNISLGKLINVSAELNRQLEEWYMSIPESLRPPLGTEAIANDRGKVLRLRFYAARHIIHRPFVLYAALKQQQAVSRATSVGSSPVSPHLSTGTVNSAAAVAHAAATAAASTAATSAAASAAAAAVVAAAAAAAQQPVDIPQIALDKCEVCIATCQTYLRNSAEMLDKRSPYLWTFSQTSMASLLVLVACDNIPQLRHLTTDLKEFKELLVSKLRMWATPGSSFEAEVRILERITTRERTT